MPEAGNRPGVQQRRFQGSRLMGMCGDGGLHFVFLVQALLPASTSDEERGREEKQQQQQQQRRITSSLRIGRGRANDVSDALV